MKTLRAVVLVASALFLLSCAAPRIKLYPGRTDPLQEFVLSGKAEQKVLVIPIRGIIADQPKQGLLRSEPSVVEETVAHLRKAGEDGDIRAVLFKIDSPGGTVTASDILYHEIERFKQRTGKKIVAAMMGMAASGGYYVSLPADYILAHPTTVTGSVGVIFLRPRLEGLMTKIGVGVEVSKSGRNKDMNSPFRASSQEEKEMMQAQTEAMGRRFVDLVRAHRTLSEASLEEISSGRIYLADEALKLGMVDEVGYLEDALSQAKRLAGLAEDAKVIIYRRTEYPDDTLYNTATASSAGDGGPVAVIDLNIPGLASGFYYLWPPAALSF